MRPVVIGIGICILCVGIRGVETLRVLVKLTLCDRVIPIGITNFLGFYKYYKMPDDYIWRY